ncbi:MAG: MFS transporter [Dehalococcoidia bacterium]|nr:MFS transporter [Dehalococcoidia bacterium]
MRRYIIFGTVGMVMFLTTFGASAVSVALPTMRSDFHSSLILIGWVVSGYMLTLTISVALGGRLSDAFGQKPVFMSSLLIFTLGTLLCLLAPNVESLIIFRLIQGLGAGALTSCGVAIVAGEFADSRQRAIGLLISIVPFGTLAGPNIGGWITPAWGWRSVFWVNLPVLAAACVIAALLLKPGKRKESHLDLAGAGMLTAFLSAIMVGLSLIRQNDTPWIWVSVLFIVGVAIIAIFVRRESRVSNPIVNIEFLRGRSFAASNVYNFVFGASTYAVSAFAPTYAVAVYHETTLKSGVIMTPRSLGMLLISTVTSMYVLRLGYRWPMLLGTVVMGLSIVFLAIEPRSMDILGFHLGGTDFLLIFMALSGLGMGAIVTAINNICVDLAPQQAATVTGIRSMFLNAGASVGIVVASLILNRSNDLTHGFSVVFTGLAVVCFASIPLIFLLPSRASTSIPSKGTG